MFVRRVWLAKQGSRCARYDCQIDPEKKKCNQKIPFPMVTKGDPESDACDEADDVSDVSDVGIITRYPASFGDHYDVVDEVDDGHQPLGREEKPRELERADKHD